MSVFIIKNQAQQFLNKDQTWQDGKDRNSLYRSKFNDEALNQLIELNAKDISIRGEVIEVELDDKLQPIAEITPSSESPSTEDNPENHSVHHSEPKSEETLE